MANKTPNSQNYLTLQSLVHEQKHFTVFYGSFVLLQ